MDNSKNSQFGLPKLGVFSWRIWRGAVVFAEARHCPGKFSCGQRRGLVVFAFQKPQTLSLRRSISLLYMPRRGEVFILAKRGAIGLSRFQPRRQLYFGGGEGQSCQFFLHPRGHLLLFRQDDCHNFAPLERRHLDSGRKAAVLFVFGGADFSCRRCFPLSADRKPFMLARLCCHPAALLPRHIFPALQIPRPESLFPSHAAFPRSFRILPPAILKCARWACLLGKNRI